MENENESVSPELVRQLTERAAAEMGNEVASLIPLLISDIVREFHAMDLNTMQVKTVKIPLTVHLLSPTAGKVYIGECSWDLRARRKQPGFPPIEVDLAQPELEFAPDEVPEESVPKALPPASRTLGYEEPYPAATWIDLEAFAIRNGFSITRPADPDAGLPDASTYIEVFKPERQRWERFCLGSSAAVASALEYAESPDVNNIVLAEGDWQGYPEPACNLPGCPPRRMVVTITDESVRKLLKRGAIVVDVLPRFEKPEESCYVSNGIECELGEDGNILRVPTPCPGSAVTVNTHWSQLMGPGALPLTLPWPPPQKNKARV